MDIDINIDAIPKRKKKQFTAVLTVPITDLQKEGLFWVKESKDQNPLEAVRLFLDHYFRAHGGERFARK